MGATAMKDYGGSFGNESLGKAEVALDVKPLPKPASPASALKVVMPDSRPLSKLKGEAAADPGWPVAAPAATVRRLVKDQRRFIHNLRNTGPTSPDTPTAERLVQARGGFEVEGFEEQVEIQGEDGKPATQEIKGRRVRMSDIPLTMLKDRGLLAPGDKFANAFLAQVGKKYFEEWFNSGKHSIAAMDFSKPFVNGSQVPSGYFQNEWQRDQFYLWTNARESIYSRFQAPVDNLVLYEMDLVSVGRNLHNGATHAAQCRAVALFCVRAGLENLADHYSRGKRWRRPS